MLLVTSCSTKKNTGATRFWHAFTGRYNTYYNGTLAYIDASLEKENGNQDNFTERIPLYTVGNKASRDLGKSNYETAITKCQKVIQLHSIKKRPEWTKNRRKTAKDLEWLSRKEYNPFIWRAWLLMGRSQFYKGEFDEAAATFSYMSRLFKGQPAIYGKAQAWLAKCYVENNWLYNAEDVIHNMQRDSVDWRAQKEWDYTLCDYYLHCDSLDKASEYLQRVIKHEMRSKQRAREYYLLGQIEAAQGHRELAYKAFKKVLRQHPPYQLQFNARISMTEVMAQGQAKKMIGKLRSMARNQNNAEYQDQIYYAIGNIYMAEKDTTKAIEAYERGVARATRSGIEKGVLLLHLGDIYWTKEKFNDAQRCYGQAIGLLDKERKDYEQLSQRSKVLDELVPYTDNIHLQDSLQALALMDEKDRNAAIDRTIEALKKKEKEEANKKAEEEAAKNGQGNNSAANANLQQSNQAAKKTSSAFGNQQSTWYFYNAQAVLQGRQAFQRIWGKRENKDNWRRSNVTVVAIGGADEAELTDEQRDSIAAEEKKQEELEAHMDSAVNNPHKREYYLAQIPFTDEQRAASDAIIKEGLLKSGIIFKDKLDNLPLSEKALSRLVTQYPDCEPKDEIYYHLFLLHSRKGETDEAKKYVEKMKAECAGSKLTATVTDPYFVENARYGTHLEDSIYGATYEAFKADRFKEVYSNVAISDKRFPLGANRDRFLFIDGLTRLNDGDAHTCLKRMETVVKDYPQSSVSEMAGMIVKGVQEGRRLHGAKFDLTNVWDRRTDVLGDGDSIAAMKFSDDRNADFLFVFAYVPDSLNENQLLFQLARYNFTSFMVRNFDLSITEAQGMHHLTVGGFRNFDEARQYSKILMNQESIRRVADKARAIVISRENLEMIGQRYSYNDYDTFYVAHFAPLPPRGADGLYEPVVEEKPESRTTQHEVREGTIEREEKDDDPVAPALPAEDVAPGGAMPTKTKSELEEEDTETTLPAQTDIEIPAEQPQEKTETQTIDVPVEQPQEKTETQTIDVPVEQPQERTETPTIEIPVDQTLEKAETPTIDVPVEQPEEAKPSDGGIDIPVTTQKETEAPANDNEITLPVDETTTTTDTGIDIIAPDNGSDASTQQDEIIIVDEKKETDKPSTDILEDEYIELDGF